MIFKFRSIVYRFLAALLKAFQISWNFLHRKKKKKNENKIRIMQIRCITYAHLTPNIRQFPILNSIFNKNKTVSKFTNEEM